MSERISKEQVLAYLEGAPAGPMGFKDLASALRVSHSGSRHLKHALRELVRDGLVAMHGRGRYALAARPEIVRGYFEAHREGFGFVISEKPGERDLFIPPRATLNAMDGDTVEALMDNTRRRAGRIVRIVSHSLGRISGTVDCATPGVCFVRARKRSVPFEIFIPQDEMSGARHLDNAIVEIMTYPTETRGATGRIVKVMGSAETPEDAVQAILDEYNLPLHFPGAVIEDAARLSALDPGERADIRDLRTVTIDGETAKDFDDAVSIKKMRGGGGYTLWVHIADVGHYVRWDTPVDREARERGTSVYFPGKVIPMLPMELSEDLCSLRPREDRLAFTIEMRFDAEGHRKSARFYPSLINSNERMTYTSVARILIDEDTEECARYEPLIEDFRLMGELARLIKATRVRRGSLDFDLPEPEVLLDLRGRPENIVRAERNFAHQIIEDFMIAANEAVAERMQRLMLPSLYRIHEEPDEVKLSEALALITGSPVRRGGRRRYDSGASPSPMALRSLLSKARGTEREEVIMYIVLRSLKQARYSPENAGHFGLASKCYTHFTSPIRRYPDLVVHRILRETLATGKLSTDRKKWLTGRLMDIANHSSHMERRADEVENEIVNTYRVWFMKDRLGEEFAASVVRVNQNGIYVRLDEHYVEGFIGLDGLEGDYYLYDEHNMMLRGKASGHTIRLGQPMRVRLDRVDLDLREMHFSLIK